MAVAIIIYLAVVILMVASSMDAFSKAGKPGWACIVPIYGLVVTLELSSKPMWWIAMIFIPLVNIVFLFRIYFLFFKVYGKSVGYAIASLFVGVVLFPMMAFSDDTKYIYGDAEEIGVSSIRLWCKINLVVSLMLLKRLSNNMESLLFLLNSYSF